MQRKRFDSLLASAALAAILTVTGAGGGVFAQSSPSIEAGIPTPDTSPVAPPTAAEVAPPAPVSSTATPSAPAPTAPVAAAPEPVPATGANASAVPDLPAQAAPVQTATPVPNPVVRPQVTTETTGAVVPASAPVGADAAIADQLRGLSAGKYDRILGGRRDRAGVETFYTGRNFAPLWIAEGALNERARATIAYLAGVSADGLDPADYPVPSLNAGSDAETLAEAEIRLTDAVMTYARHAQMGRVHYTRLAADIEFDLKRPDPAEVLAALASTGSVAAALDALQPQHRGYKALKAKLAEARKAGGQTSAPRIATGPMLRITKDKQGREVIPNDPRVPLLRERLGVTANPASTAYDKDVAAAVSKLQKERGLPATGRLTDATVAAINGPSRERDVDVIVANLDRWRWMPRDLGKIYVMVNIPDYTLEVVRDGKRVWKTNIVVGKPSQATPIMTGEMKFITVNPTWNVPPSIIRNEYLPALASDPNILARMGLKIAHNADGTVRVWQPPGEKNALGRIRFNFPNRFLVYQHDTPDKHLFKHSKRAYSHGCMRVEDPLKYGEVLLSLVRPNDNYTADRLRKMFGGSEINISFPTTIPVHLTYQTAFVDDAGKLAIREDIYGRDARMIAQLKGAERRLADVPLDRPRPSYAAPVRVPPGGVPGVRSAGGGNWNGGGTHLFDRLFGGGFEEPAQAPAQRQRARSARTDQHRVR